MQKLNKIMARARHSLGLDVEMDHFRYCTDNFLGVKSVALSATPKLMSLDIDIIYTNYIFRLQSSDTTFGALLYLALF